MGGLFAAAENRNPVKEKRKMKEKAKLKAFRHTSGGLKIIHFYIYMSPSEASTVTDYEGPSCPCEQLPSEHATQTIRHTRVASVTCSSAERTVLKRRDEETTRNDPHRAYWYSGP